MAAVGRHRKRFTRKKQKGGFYPSVMSGVQNAILLTPAALRVGFSLLSRNSTVRRRRRSNARRSRRQRRSAA